MTGLEIYLLPFSVPNQVMVLLQEMFRRYRRLDNLLTVARSRFR